MSLSHFIDLLERLVVSALFLFLCIRMSDQIANRDPIYTTIVIVEFSVLYFVIFRKLTSTISVAPRDWFIAVLGSSLATLVVPGSHPPLVPDIASEFCIVFGCLIQIHGKLTLRRSFGIVAANRGVRTGGPYVVVRHPIYMGYTITHIGFLLHAPNAWNAGIYVANLAFQIARILAEERILSKDELYREYTARVPYRLLPGLF
jgi:protein-S-isoprenylcysteine O-methyltransferase Ste14